MDNLFDSLPNRQLFCDLNAALKKQKPPHSGIIELNIGGWKHSIKTSQVFQLFSILHQPRNVNHLSIRLGQHEIKLNLNETILTYTSNSETTAEHELTQVIARCFNTVFKPYDSISAFKAMTHCYFCFSYTLPHMLGLIGAYMSKHHPHVQKSIFKIWEQQHPHIHNNIKKVIPLINRMSQDELNILSEMSQPKDLKPFFNMLHQLIEFALFYKEISKKTRPNADLNMYAKAKYQHLYSSQTLTLPNQLNYIFSSKEVFFFGDCDELQYQILQHEQKNCQDLINISDIQLKTIQYALTSDPNWMNMDQKGLRLSIATSAYLRDPSEFNSSYNESLFSDELDLDCFDYLLNPIS